MGGENGIMCVTLAISVRSYKVEVMCRKLGRAILYWLMFKPSRFSQDTHRNSRCVPPSRSHSHLSRHVNMLRPAISTDKVQGGERS